MASSHRFTIVEAHLAAELALTGVLAVSGTDS